MKHAATTEIHARRTTPVTTMTAFTHARVQPSLWTMAIHAQKTVAWTVMSLILPSMPAHAIRGMRAWKSESAMLASANLRAVHA